MTIKYSELSLGQIEAIVNKLGGMDGVQRFLSGSSEVVVKRHVIDTNADPFVPEGWKVEEHQTTGPRNTGLVEWNPSKVSLWLASGQQNGKSMQGHKLRTEVAKKSPFNANVLDYLLANPHLIPEEWKGKYVFFWGTIYRDRGEDLCVRCLYWRVVRWDWSNGWLGNDFLGDSPAALPAS